ncbi:hypothetical protein COO60DRAFT_1511726 [Scenedesmus sp. NREL 46B-D3]|nr:hypothetical protein COO60DRAFT_1511726 [Scenedesmus sp. NREL 46B-D3]
MRSMDSFSSGATEASGGRAAAAASLGAGVSAGAPPQPGMHTMQMHSSVQQACVPGMHAGAGGGALFGSVTSLPGMVGREGSLDGSGLGSLVAPGPSSAPVAVPTRSLGVPDAAMMAAASSLGTSPGMGPSPAATYSGMEDASAAAAAAAAAPQQQQQAAAAAAAAACLCLSAVSPEEVVKHAQLEVQKLEAQAQAQAVAAMQVSAAAQRAEAEAQKHLVVHAQVAAQAQQLQAKAEHLQVREAGHSSRSRCRVAMVFASRIAQVAALERGPIFVAVVAVC